MGVVFFRLPGKKRVTCKSSFKNIIIWRDSSEQTPIDEIVITVTVFGNQNWIFQHRQCQIEKRFALLVNAS